MPVIVINCLNQCIYGKSHSNSAFYHYYSTFAQTAQINIESMSLSVLVKEHATLCILMGFQGLPVDTTLIIYPSSIQYMFLTDYQDYMK